MHRVFLGLGSNIGDRAGFLRRAISKVQAVAPVRSVSGVYETEPVGVETDRMFYNMVIEVETPLRPSELLDALKEIERMMGRKPGTHMMNREIDIDILLYEGISYADETVSVPHPRLEHRRFVLEPFREIAPLVVHPTLNQTIASLCRICHDPSKVVRTGVRIEPAAIAS